ncbi:M23 family metallopeptidase [Brevibacillus fluminis]|uniref:M23 family metallopeptidase n=2 Tax=Brevibacillus fluminis TaxID=511487 RepID=A0A3M8CWU6_9BACL|nr:M23 family metallopeptidase [Brevibacillus fluminis]
MRNAMFAFCTSLALAAGSLSSTNAAQLPAIAPTATATAPAIHIQPSTIGPGDVLLVTGKQAGSVVVMNKTYSLQKSGDQFVRFIPIPIDAKPATYSIVTADKKAKAVFTIQKKAFAQDSITVSKQMEGMQQNTKRIEADQKRINKARSQSAAVPYFTDKFQMPVQGRLSTPYGYQRVVNGKISSRHLAIDIANKEGTPVAASQNGKVVLAEYLYLTGYTVMIDHGLNVFSSYGHMSKLDVKAGQIVKKGQVIGKVGTTGFSTGPHLHYAMLIGNTFINPNPFFQANPFDWK